MTRHPAAILTVLTVLHVSVWHCIA